MLSDAFGQHQDCMPTHGDARGRDGGARQELAARFGVTQEGPISWLGPMVANEDPKPNSSNETLWNVWSGLRITLV
jgi:hypothetical protein